MGLSGFNRQRRAGLIEKVGAENAKKLISMGFTDAEKLTRIDQVADVLTMNDKERAEVKKLAGMKGKPKENDNTEYPVHKGGGYYILSNGDQVQGKKEAVKAQSELDGE